MRPMRPRFGPRESVLVQQVRGALRVAGWTIVQKIHGSAYQAGLPDLFCFKPPARSQWVEVKKRRGSRLTGAQRARFAEWEAAGLGVWVLTSAEDVAKLDGPANWRDFLPKSIT